MGLMPNQKIQMKKSNGEVYYINCEELSRGSAKKVKVICDCCGAEKDVCYKNYYNTIQNHNGKYICRDCCNHNEDYLLPIRSKAKNTCKEKYGTETPSKLKSFQEKAQKTCVSHYGVQNPMLVPEIKDKQKETLYSNYGVHVPYHSKEIRERGEATLYQNYGVCKPSHSKTIRAKANTTLRSHGEVCISKQELELGNIIKKHYGEENVKLSVGIGVYTLDIELHYNGIVINIECDGYYWHCRTKQQIVKDIIRDKFIKKNGYDKIARVVYDHTLPPANEIISMLDSFINSEHTFTRFYSKDIPEELQI